MLTCLGEGDDMKKKSIKRGLIICGVGTVIWVVAAVVIFFSYPWEPGMTDLEFREVWEGVWVIYRVSGGVGMLAALIGFAMTIAGLVTKDS